MKRIINKQFYQYQSVECSCDKMDFCEKSISKKRERIHF